MMELYKNAKLQEGSTARQNLVRDRMKEINDVRRQLNLPTPEQMGVPVISEEPTEAPVEETTSVPEPTETLTEESTVEATQETEGITQPVETTIEPAVKEAETDPANGGPLLWIILGVVLVVMAGATAIAVIIRKRQKS